MSKDASDLFPNTERPVDSQLVVILNRLRKGYTLAEWEKAVLQAAGIPPDEVTARILNGLDFVQKYGAKVGEPSHGTGSYKEVNAAFKGILRGYHLNEIKRGKFGERSKILEEMLEVEDAHTQGNAIMLLLEMSDLVGAIQGYLATHRLTLADLKEYASTPYHPIPFSNILAAFNKFRSDESKVGDFQELDEVLWLIGCYVIRFNLRFEDVLRMTETTHRAFESGHRKPKEVA